MRTFVSVVAVLLATGLSSAGTHRVSVVYDGDTFQTADSLVVRLLGIDAPESYQPGGDIAGEILGKYVQGRQVRLEADSEDKDQYGRVLRYVYVGDTLVNLEMVRKGYAAFRMFQAHLKYQDTLAKAEQEAARIGRGLWAFNVFTPPTPQLMEAKVRAESLRADSGKPGLQVVSWLDAGTYEGKLVTVDGTVVATHNSGNVCHLNFHEDYRKYFSVVMFGQDLAKFPPRPEDYYLKRHVRVTGIVKDYKGAPEIAVSDPAQIEVLK
jgi:micrococcal nuclease